MLFSQAELTATDLGMFHFADPALSPLEKHKLFRASTPALAEMARLPKARLQGIIGMFGTALEYNAEPAILESAARKALGLRPGEPVRALELASTPQLGHCPAPVMLGVDGTPSSLAVLDLADLAAAETIWRPD
ncbi:hypothetical protein ACFYO1_02065 [Nocardia sp. NPDC006044]|uniref:hypothetical protein n=1 Tax=Nocardia sp. NPDC006044 TaxID=3364306 RepID=UPI0036CCD946